MAIDLQTSIGFQALSRTGTAWGWSCRPSVLKPIRASCISPPKRAARFPRSATWSKRRKALRSWSGEVGTGKTTLASWFHSRYQRRPDFIPARVDEPPKRSGLLLLRRIAAEFGLRTRRATEHQMKELRTFLTKQAKEGILPLLIIDEAHELEEEQFMTLRRLLNFRNPEGWQGLPVDPARPS